ncbi:hypothetical protein JW916_01585 [Candidatus Sumerlaeota bacterium]|nr:hypothetical protein [Candidatus Sumerlaeota bacterium]
MAANPTQTRPGFSRRSRLDFLLAVMVFAAPFASPGNVIFPYPGLLGADRPQYHLPYMQFEYDWLRQGVIPFWNPYVYGGTPEFGNPERAPMYPVHFFPAMFLGPVMMMKIKFLFHLGLAGLGCFLFLRALSVRGWLAVLSALTLEASGWPVTKIAIPNVGDSAAWIPLMLFLSLRFVRRPTLGRGLVLALLGGFMLNLFFPQITLTLIGLCALVSAVHFVKVRGATRPAPPAAVWIDRLFLPALELVVLLLLWRYPKGAVPFPQEGWRCAFNSFGRIGVGALILIAVLWMVWLGLRGLRVRVDWRGLGRWAVRFAGVWILAASLAAPQLAITSEFIPLSNQAGLEYGPDDYFTGVQAYGCIQEFVIQSGLLRRPFAENVKESINNMAVGPVVHALVLAGILAGFHRRSRWFLFLVAGSALVGAVYFAAPGIYEAWIRLPFFRNFSGLSRYLGFLNVFLIVLAALSAEIWLKRLRRGLGRSLPGVLVTAALIANLGLLVHHQTLYWRHVREGAKRPIPEAVARMVERHVAPDERLIVDARNRPDDYQPLLMFGMTHRFHTLPTIAPMRLMAYDRWMRGHNDSLGVNHDDYRAGLFEPTPSPWTRAMRVSAFLLPPGAEPGAGWGKSPGAPVPLDEWGGWRLVGDRDLLPAAWPEDNLDRDPPVPEIPEGWRVELTLNELHRLEYRVFNPLGPTWMAVPMARYPGWRAWVATEAEPPPDETGIRAAPRGRGRSPRDRRPPPSGSPPPSALGLLGGFLAGDDSGQDATDDGTTRTIMAYRFLQSVPIPSGESIVRLEYSPGRFALGWFLFLWGVWVSICLAVRTRLTGPASPADPAPPEVPAGWRKAFETLAIGGLIPAALIGARVWNSVPDVLLVRLGEIVLVGLLSYFSAAAIRRAYRERPLTELDTEPEPSPPVSQ